MPKCKNDPKSSYTGKEPSPRGKGFCAKKEQIGTKKRGKDGEIWIVKKRKDGINFWTKFSNKKSGEQVIKLSKKKKYRMKGGMLPIDPISIMRSLGDSISDSISEPVKKIIIDEVTFSNQKIKAQLATSKFLIQNKIEELQKELTDKVEFISDSVKRIKNIIK